MILLPRAGVAKKGRKYKEESMVRRYKRQIVSRILLQICRAKKHCSLANTCMPKANTGDFADCNWLQQSHCGFNDLHAPAGLAYRMPIQIAGILARFKLGPQVQF
jgi:hypothetical protein